uniref:Uncharacterized protein n=1 Tax=Anguilla anguilla TaxID=7936 RepID=A0A0E9Q415_ANGAN
MYSAFEGKAVFQDFLISSFKMVEVQVAQQIAEKSSTIQTNSLATNQH